MATKFILHGGFANHINTYNDSFFKEILKDTQNNPKVLLVYFAKELDRIVVNKKEDVGQFERNKENKNISFEVADEKSFVEQVKTADIVYLHGGNTLKLLETLKKFENLEKLFEGKIVAGESAGAYVLSSFFYSKKVGGIFQGFGFVPIKTICHYTGEDLEKFPDNSKLETLLLQDYQYQIFLK
ncbi:MAG: Type 1 glutamine amidotransferase-like domain-containing protein [Patescibacteria group bacterium]